MVVFFTTRCLSGNAATIIRGHFSYMYGTDKRYTRFKCEPFDLPLYIYLNDCELKNERHFIEFLLRNDWIQRQLGIKMDNSNGLFPDVQGEIYDGTGDRIRVEIEFRAENFIAHRHAYKGCDLIISFIRNEGVRFIKGIPVWSFYEGCTGDNYIYLCLHKDMNFDFNDYAEY